jgi:hypothetical protein
MSSPTETAKLIMRGIDMSTALGATKVTGLCAIVFGLMAFSTSLAQAEPGAHWKINGADLQSPLLPQIQVSEVEPYVYKLKKDGVIHEIRQGFLLSEISPGVKVEILCTEIEFIDGLLHELGRATGKILFKKCRLLRNEVVQGACEVTTAGSTKEHITTNALDALIKLHKLEGEGKDDLLEVLPTAGIGKPFVSFSFGTECAIGNKIDITGVAFLKDCKNLGLVEEKEHLFEEGPLTELFFGIHLAKLDGSAKVKLVGSHEGLKWSGIAN